MRFTPSILTAIAVQMFAFFLVLVAAAPLPAPVPVAAAERTSGNATELEARGPVHWGTATWYGQQSRGACGKWHTNSDMIVAVSGRHFKMSMCGRTVAVTHGRKTIYATVQDECPECPSGNLDISRGMFTRWASLDVGVLPIHWHFV
ncbi:hypothetical protein OC834_007718 [Tilletia horrida]|nr:hypothetical protein OC834_007718 [Tilletia horrida]KAK0567941.1 hypothetical protein OC844_000031 [Tilletia horrida]